MRNCIINYIEIKKINILIDQKIKIKQNYLVILNLKDKMGIIKHSMVGLKEEN